MESLTIPVTCRQFRGWQGPASNRGWFFSPSLWNFGWPPSGCCGASQANRSRSCEEPGQWWESGNQTAFSTTFPHTDAWKCGSDTRKEAWRWLCSSRNWWCDVEILFPSVPKSPVINISTLLHIILLKHIFTLLWLAFSQKTLWTLSHTFLLVWPQLFRIWL